MNLKKGGKRLENFNKAYKNAKAKQARAIKKAAQATGLKEYEIKENIETMAKLNIPVIPPKADLKKSIEAGSVKHYNAQMKLLTAYNAKNAETKITIGRGKNKITATQYDFIRFEAEKKLVIESQTAFLNELKEAAKTGTYKGYTVNVDSINEKIQNLEEYIQDLKDFKYSKSNQKSFDIVRESVDKQGSREYNDTLRHKHIKNTLSKDWKKNFGDKKSKALIKKAEQIGWDVIRTLQVGGVNELSWVFPYLAKETTEDKNRAFENINEVLDNIIDMKKEGELMLY